MSVNVTYIRNVKRPISMTGDNPEPMTDNQYGEGSDPIWLDDVVCTGSEVTIDSCQHGEWGENDCGHYEDVGVKCGIQHTDDSHSDGDIALIGGLGPYQGRLEIYHDNVWKPVCDDLWSATREPAVACRQLGYEGGHIIRNNFGTNGGEFWLDNVSCQGSESRLADCYHNGWGLENCAPNEAVAVQCVQLADGAYPWHGRVEIYYNSQWGTICNQDHRWGRSEARVVCKQLGYQHGEALVDLEYGEGSGIIHLAAVQCTGNETNLLQCGASTSTASCSHSNDVAVECLNISAR